MSSHLEAVSSARVDEKTWQWWNYTKHSRYNNDEAADPLECRLLLTLAAFSLSLSLSFSLLHFFCKKRQRIGSRFRWL